MVRWLHLYLEGTFPSREPDDENLPAEELHAQRAAEAVYLAQRSSSLSLQMSDSQTVETVAEPPQPTETVPLTLEPIAPVAPPPPDDDAYMRDPDWLTANLYYSLQPDERKQIWGDRLS